MAEVWPHLELVHSRAKCKVSRQALSFQDTARLSLATLDTPEAHLPTEKRINKSREGHERLKRSPDRSPFGF